MKKLFKIALLIAINIVGAFTILYLFDLITKYGIGIFETHHAKEKFIFASCFFLFYACSNFFQIKTLRQKEMHSSNNNSNSQLLDMDMDIDIGNSNKMPIKSKKIKFPLIIWIGNMMTSILSFYVVLGVISVDLFSSSPVTPFWFKLLTVCGILFLAIGILIDMVMVWNGNLKKVSKDEKTI